jgi:thymidylate kinase
MIIVLEGIPGAGKTTIIQELKRRNYATVQEIILSFELIKSLGVVGWILNDFLKAIIAIYKNFIGHKIVFIDRGYLSTSSVWHVRHKSKYCIKLYCFVMRHIYWKPYIILLNIDPYIGLKRKKRNIDKADIFKNPDLLLEKYKWIANNTTERISILDAETEMNNLIECIKLIAEENNKNV